MPKITFSYTVHCFLIFWHILLNQSTLKIYIHDMTEQHSHMCTHTHTHILTATITMGLVQGLDSPTLLPLPTPET